MTLVNRGSCRGRYWSAGRPAIGAKGERNRGRPFSSRRKVKPYPSLSVVPLGPDIDWTELPQAEGREDRREGRAQAEGVPARLQVEVEVVRRGRAEGPVVGQPQRLGLPRLVHQGGPGGQLGIGEAAVVVVAQGQHQVQGIAEGGLALHVAADLVQVVVLLVAAHDRAVRVGPRQQGVDAVGEALAAAQAGGVLGLEHGQRRPVDDGHARAQQVGAARIAPVAEGLEEPVAVEQAQLGVVVLPVDRLGGR